jgi:hypothetical protein
MQDEIAIELKGVTKEYKLYPNQLMMAAELLNIPFFQKK